MAGITWWTSDRLTVLARLAGEGRTAASIAWLLNKAYRRRPPISAGAVREVARTRGIPLLARGGRPFAKAP